MPGVTKNFKSQRIKIAFHPLSEKFELSNAAIEKGAESIPDLSILWQPDTKPHAFKKKFLEKLGKRRPLTAEEEDIIHESIDRLIKLEEYPPTALESSSSCDEDEVSEIFVRINSKG